jgi:hypothetical protein
VSHHRLIVLFLFVFLDSAASQRSQVVDARVLFPDGTPCTAGIRVRLIGHGSGNPIAEKLTDTSGRVEFGEVEAGNYHLVVSGDGVQETSGGSFEVDASRGSQIQLITVRRVPNGTAASFPGGAAISVADMRIPKSAAEQFDKAVQLMGKQEWQKALERLQHALHIYPQYVQAYNNLGVVYERLGRRDSERSAFEQAVQINDHFAPGWLNLGRMAVADRDFPGAETLLILANVELLNRHYDQAIAHSEKVHAMGQSSHALVHFIAARAFESEHRKGDAENELHIFLNEEPSGARADAARKELATITTRQN